MITIFPNFKKLGLEDKPIVEGFVRRYLPYSDFNFVSLWSYNTNDSYEISYLNKNLVIKQDDYITNEPFISFIGKNKLMETIESLINYAKTKKINTTLRLIPKDILPKNISILSRKYIIEKDPDNFDYIMSIDNLLNLRGKKFKSKRKWVNTFKKMYPEHEIKELDLCNKNIQKEIIKLFNKWEEIRNKKRNETIRELKAIKKLMRDSKQFKLKNIGVYHKGKLISFSINEAVHKNYYMGHFGKADYAYRGSFQYLEYITAHMMNDGKIKYMNFEQDMGEQNLKSSKLSWKPTHMLEKYTIREKE